MNVEERERQEYPHLECGRVCEDALKISRMTNARKGMVSSAVEDQQV